MAEAGGMVTVSGQPSLLYVTSGSPTLGHLFIDAGWAVRTLEPAALPGIAARLRDFDAVVIENGDASRLTPTQVTGLTEYVQNMAGGLLVLGGTSTLASFRTSPLAGILPVDVRPRTGARRPGMALVLAFDKSGSMADVVGGVSKIELARQSVLGAVQAIPSTDLFGAIAFDSGPRIIAPLAAGNDVTNITQRLRALEAGGSTAIAPAIDLAETWLRQSGVSRKRVLLVTDGRTAEADTERLRQAVRSGQFELSVVAIGNDADRSLLTSLATTSGGRAYFPTDVGELPRIVARDAAGGSSGTTVSESFFARVLPHGMTRGIDPATPPRLTGYSVTAAKSGADVVITSHLDDPVLAAWRAGLGRVAVFTSDIDSANARTFATWPAFRQLWSQAIRWVGRQTDSTGSILALDVVNQGLLAGLTFEPPDGPDRIVDARATIRSGSGTVESLPLALVSPGRFEAIASLSDPGPHVASLAIRHADGRDDQIVRGVYWMPPAERPGPADRAFLEEIARTTGGRVLTSRDSPFDGDRPGEPTNVAPLLVNVALMAVIADIARKRGLFPLRTRRPVGPPRASQHAAA